MGQFTRQMQRKHGKKPRRPQGHPARVQRELAKRSQATPEEIEVRRLNRKMWEEAQRSSKEQALVGPIAVLAEHVAGLAAERWPELDTDEHRLAVAHYLTERLGAVIDGFDPAEYETWRERCLEVATR